MTVAGSGRPTRLDIARQHVEQAFGPTIAKRVDTFDDGTLYVTAGGWRRLLAWLADFVTYLLFAGAGFVAFALATRTDPVSDSAAALIVLGLLIGTPLVYGLFFGNGRAVGAALTGTRLVRATNGGRIGASACWAMLVRTVLFPLLLLVFVTGGTAEGSIRRISIDDDATRRLHETGLRHRDAIRLP
ncbi:RDD family protein [Lentzea sp. HUAS12]|uniref:RDD family protein n=1 Tax=Lentzea sp. HUAS12 TaxID=2951806 RepID=UPI00209E10D2|nr:RDD family protein [Lentzea sp. HUAS12]USX49889.1 RDD family protein [Lentzea sp. HUAS12]